MVTDELTAFNIVQDGISWSIPANYSDRKKTFFAALGLSALAGYETVNWGESLLPDGSRLTDEDNFIYGGALTLELSAYVTDKIVLLVNGRQRVLFGGDCGKFHTQVGVGIRFMIR